MNELSTLSWTFEDDVLQYSRAGFEAIGVWRPKLTDFGEERGLELLCEQQMQVSNLMWAGGFTGSEGCSYHDSVQDGVEAIELAAQINAECLVIYTGSRSGHTGNHARRLCKSAIDELLPVANDLGVVLAIEPVHDACDGEWSIVHGIDDSLEFIDYFDSRYVKLVFDTNQLGRAKLDFGQLERIADRIALIRVTDSRRAVHGELNCCLPGQGIIPIGEIVAAFADGGYTGYCDVKVMGEDVELCPYEEVLRHSRASLHDLTSV